MIAIFYISGCVASNSRPEVILSPTPDETSTPQPTDSATQTPKTPEQKTPEQSSERAETPTPAPTMPVYRDTPGDLPPMPNIKEYHRLKGINSDVVGWLHVPNTRIDYPVVRTDNNDYYLERTVEKKSLKAGSIFMDYRNVDESQQRHVIIYGHNMKSGSMFKTLNNYKNADFFENNKVLTYYWDEKPVQYEVYAAFIASEDTDFLRTKFRSGAEFESYMQGLKELSKFKSDVKITQDDQVLTLMTCSYEMSDARFVVQARRIQG